MKNYLAAIWLGLSAAAVQAVEMAISPQDVYQRIKAEEPNILFVDVRDPVEIMFVGFTDAVHANVPYLLVDRSQWDKTKGVYRVSQNPAFLAGIQKALKQRGLGADAEIITLCRSGSERGKPSADYLRANGFANARYVADGFQGPVIKEGEHAGFRLKSGWQNSGLPWGYKLNPEKMYLPDTGLAY